MIYLEILLAIYVCITFYTLGLWWDDLIDKDYPCWLKAIGFVCFFISIFLYHIFYSTIWQTLKFIQKHDPPQLKFWVTYAFTKHWDNLDAKTLEYLNGAWINHRPSRYKMFCLRKINERNNYKPNKGE